MAAIKQLNPKAEVARAAQALDLNISGKFFTNFVLHSI